MVGSSRISFRYASISEIARDGSSARLTGILMSGADHVRHSLERNIGILPDGLVL